MLLVNIFIKITNRKLKGGLTDEEFNKIDLRQQYTGNLKYLTEEQLSKLKKGVITEEKDLDNKVIQKIKEETLGILIPKTDAYPLILAPILPVKTSITEVFDNISYNSISNTLNDTNVIKELVSPNKDIENKILKNISSFFNNITTIIPNFFENFINNLIPTDVSQKSKTLISIINKLKSDLPNILKEYTKRVKETLNTKLSTITSIINKLISKNKTFNGGLLEHNEFGRTIIVGSIKLIINEKNIMKLYNTTEEILNLNYLIELLSSYINLNYISKELKEFKNNVSNEIKQIFDSDIMAFPPSSYSAVIEKIPNPNVGKRYIIPNLIKILIGYIRYLINNFLSLIQALLNPEKLKLSLRNSFEPVITNETKEYLNIDINKYNVKIE